MPNAFAMGRSQKTTTVCATRGHPRPALPGRARRRDRPRAHARDQPRRDGDDAGQLLRDAGGADHPVRASSSAAASAAAARATRRRTIVIVIARLGARLRDLVPAAARALALPRVRRRPRLGDPHRPPERAGLGADQDQRHDRAGPQRRPAPRRRHERLLHRPGAHEAVADEPVRRPPAARAAPGRAAAARVPAAERRR